MLFVCTSHKVYVPIFVLILSNTLPHIKILFNDHSVKIMFISVVKHINGYVLLT